MIRPWLKMACLGTAAVWLLGIAPCGGLAQPLDTMSIPEPGARSPAGGAVPAPKDTVRLNARTPPAAVIEAGADTTSQESKPAAATGQSEQVVRLALPPDLDKKFSLFNQRNIIGIGPSLSYFYYNEHLDIDPLIREFRTLHTYQPAIAGTPKSTEYGAVLGFAINSMWVFRKPSLLLGSRFALLFGIANTYDGSSQADTFQTPGTITFVPIKDQKNNLFVTGGIDIGYAFSTARCPWGLYSGIDAKIWYRDMTLYSQQSSSASSSELYYWFSIPLGALVTRPVSPHVLLGCDARIDFMFYGGMQASETSPYGGSLDFPLLHLGNRASYRLDAFVQTRPSGSVSFKFGPYVMLYGFAASNTDTVTIPGGDYGSTDQRVGFLEPESASFWVGINFQVEFLRGRLAEVKDR